MMMSLFCNTSLPKIDAKSTKQEAVGIKKKEQ
jgi:hypothetical protein